jgi:hypothetical protein
MLEAMIPSLSFGTLEKVKLYKARHHVQMTVADNHCLSVGKKQLDELHSKRSPVPSR